MEEISVNTYLPLCEQYNSLAQSFYQQHLDMKDKIAQLGKSADLLENPSLANTQNMLTIGMLQTAISAVIFEAFAIESYVNFFGAYILGDSAYYSTYESGEYRKRYSTIEKIKMMCKVEFKTSYPTGGKHFAVLKGLFTKRDKLAHNKPKGHEISTKSGSNFYDYDEAITEISFIYEELEQEMALYDAVKENLTASSKQQEPIASFQENVATAIAKSFVQMVQGAKRSEE